MRACTEASSQHPNYGKGNWGRAAQVPVSTVKSGSWLKANQRERTLKSGTVPGPRKGRGRHLTENASLMSENLHQVVRGAEALMGCPRGMSKVGAGGGTVTYREFRCMVQWTQMVGIENSWKLSFDLSLCTVAIVHPPQTHTNK